MLHIMIGNTAVVSCGSRGPIASTAARDNIQYMAYDLDTCNTTRYAIHIRPYTPHLHWLTIFLSHCS